MGKRDQKKPQQWERRRVVKWLVSAVIACIGFVAAALDLFDRFRPQNTSPPMASDSARLSEGLTVTVIKNGKEVETRKVK